jgi:uncharacterized protein
MKIDLDTIPADQYRIQAYQTGVITVNSIPYKNSFIISPTKLITDWPPVYFTDLATQHISQITAMHPEIIILGTGMQLHFPEPELITSIFEQDIGFEVMDTGAACRCYNLLANEGRNVAAGLLMINN